MRYQRSAGQSGGEAREKSCALVLGQIGADALQQIVDDVLRRFLPARALEGVPVERAEDAGPCESALDLALERLRCLFRKQLRLLRCYRHAPPNQTLSVSGFSGSC